MNAFLIFIIYFLSKRVAHQTSDSRIFKKQNQQEAQKQVFFACLCRIFCFGTQSVHLTYNLLLKFHDVIYLLFCLLCTMRHLMTENDTAHDEDLKTCWRRKFFLKIECFQICKYLIFMKM